MTLILGNHTLTAFKYFYAEKLRFSERKAVALQIEQKKEQAIFITLTSSK